MNYKPFVSDFNDSSIDPVYFDKKVLEDGKEITIPSDIPVLRSVGIKSSSFSIKSQINAGVPLRPSPLYANPLMSMDGIDGACSMVDKLSSESNKRK